MSDEIHTFTLEEAASFLKISKCSLYQKARAGEICGAKVGKRWVFIKQDLVEYIRSQYSQPRQIALSGSRQEKSLCHSINAEKRGGFISARQVESEYVALLGLQKRK